MDQKQTVNLFLLAVLAIILFAIFKEARAADEVTFDKVYQAWETTSTEGCQLDGQFYKVGEIEAMNKADLADFKQMSGYRASDGNAVMMMCTYNVDPTSNDHPPVNERTYAWVAFSWYW
jgi:hypothetical protein